MTDTPITLAYFRRYVDVTVADWRRLMQERRGAEWLRAFNALQGDPMTDTNEQGQTSIEALRAAGFGPFGQSEQELSIKRDDDLRDAAVDDMERIARESDVWLAVPDIGRAEYPVNRDAEGAPIHATTEGEFIPAPQTFENVRFHGEVVEADCRRVAHAPRAPETLRALAKRAERHALSVAVNAYDGNAAMAWLYAAEKARELAASIPADEV